MNFYFVDLIDTKGILGDAVLLFPEHGGAQHGETSLDQAADQPLVRTFPEPQQPG